MGGALFPCNSSVITAEFVEILVRYRNNVGLHIKCIHKAINFNNNNS